MWAASTGRHLTYTVAVTVHVAASVIGFVGLTVTGIYASMALGETPRPPGQDVARYFRGRNWATSSIWLVPIAGAVGVALNRREDFGQAWVIGGMLCWTVAAITSVAVMLPAERRIRAALVPEASAGTQGPLPRAELTRLAAGVGVCDVAFAVALVLMVLRPGGP